MRSEQRSFSPGKYRAARALPDPNELALDIREYLRAVLDQSISQEFNAIDASIKELQQKRRALIDEARAKMNPKIIEHCEKFKAQHPELFI